MIHFAGHQKAIDETLGGARIFDGCQQQGLIEVGGNNMMLMLGPRRLPANVIFAVANAIDGDRIFAFVSVSNSTVSPTAIGLVEVISPILKTPLYGHSRTCLHCLLRLYQLPVDL
jgi:hypothetical protein